MAASNIFADYVEIWSIVVDPTSGDVAIGVRKGQSTKRDGYSEAHSLSSSSSSYRPSGTAHDSRVSHVSFTLRHAQGYADATIEIDGLASLNFNDYWGLLGTSFDFFDFCNGSSYSNTRCIPSMTWRNLSFPSSSTHGSFTTIDSEVQVDAGGSVVKGVRDKRYDLYLWKVVHSCGAR